MGVPPLVVVMGIAGVGKSAVGHELADRFAVEYADGDDFHPAANIAKMSAGTPLTDEDRWPWLDRIAGWIQDHTAAGIPGIVTCSALKRIYRDRLSGPNVVFVHLIGSHDLIAQRLAARKGHYMPPSLLASQFATLEEPCADENVLPIVNGREPAYEATEIIRRVGLTPQPASAKVDRRVGT
jgi:gluconokinase